MERERAKLRIARNAVGREHGFPVFKFETDHPRFSKFQRRLALDRKERDAEQFALVRFRKQIVNVHGLDMAHDGFDVRHVSYPAQDGV